MCVHHDTASFDDYITLTGGLFTLFSVSMCLLYHSLLNRIWLFWTIFKISVFVGFVENKQIKVNVKKSVVIWCFCTENNIHQ